MFNKCLLIFVVAFSFSAPTFAKGAGKNSKVKSTKHVALNFDYKYYQSLSKEKKIKYLTLLRDFVVKASAYTEKQTGKKTASIWLDLLVPEVDAAKNCFSGGLRYTSPTNSCDDMPADVQNSSATAFNGCPSGQLRCSFAFGVEADGSALCYDKSLRNSGTATCDKMSNDSGAIANLNKRIDECNVNNSDTCKSLLAALKNDTSNADFVAFCSKNAGKDYCKKTQTAIAKLNPGAAGEESPLVTPTDGGASCSAVEHKVVSEELKKSSGAGIDPKWLRLVMLTEKGCSGTAKPDFNFTSALKKFGACKGDGAPSQPSASVESALAKMQDRSLGALSSTEVGHFSDYFGVSPGEFRKVFCDSPDTLKFAEAASKLASPNNKNYDRDLVVYGLNQKGAELEAWAKQVNLQSTTMKAQFESYVSLIKDQELAQLKLDAAKGRLQSNPDSFEDKQAVADAQKAIRENSTKLGGLRSGLEFDLSRPAAKTGRTALEAGMKAADYQAFKQKYDNSAFEKQVAEGKLTSEGAAQRKKLMSCAKDSIQVTHSGGDDFNPAKIEAKSNFGSSCWASKLTGSPADMFINNKGSFIVQSSDGKQCYYSDGSTRSDSNCKPSGRALNMTPGQDLGLGARGNQPQCIDLLKDKFVVSQMHCAEPADHGTFTCADGTAVPLNADGEWNCSGHGGTPSR